jgi:DNA-binding IclR family transcriptional regulator
MQTAGGRYTVAAVTRAIDLIDAFLQPPHQFGLTELSKATGQSKNQTFRLLQTLADENVVVMDPDTKRYSLSYRVLEWGVMAHKGSPLAVAASPVLDRLVEEVGETIVLTARASDFGCICVDKRESGTHALQITARVGRRIPFHAGAGSKCILAYSSPEFVHHFLETETPLERYTDKTITDPDELLEELGRIRQWGYSISDEDFDLGACSLAAPITDHTGTVVAAVSIASPKTRFMEEDIEVRQKAVKEVARAISQQMMHLF